MELQIRDSKGNAAGSVTFPWDDIKKEIVEEVTFKLAESATMADSAKLQDSEKRAADAEAEMNGLRQMVQNYSREEWEEVGRRLGFLALPLVELKEPDSIRILRGEVKNAA